MKKAPFFIHSILLFSLLLILGACSSSIQTPIPPSSVSDPIASILDAQAPILAGDSVRSLERMGFSVQVGAFNRLDNAVRLEQSLKRLGIDAYHFKHESGFYKVRFGDHRRYADARGEAERLQNQGLIDSFFIVIPDDYPVANIKRDGQGHLRTELVRTAKRFLGVPYRWGGEDRSNGFDCSGLTMVSYRLNGLKLPRNSRSQFKAGRPVAKQRLQLGDLVFFATKGGTRVTHVGMYVGSGKFIHAPRPGKTVRIANLSSKYFKRTFVGAKSYL